LLGVGGTLLNVASSEGLFDEAFDRLDELLEEPAAAALVDAFHNREAAARYTTKADFIGELLTTLGLPTG
jgi:hypothetical protein